MKSPIQQRSTVYYDEKLCKINGNKSKNIDDDEDILYGNDCDLTQKCLVERICINTTNENVDLKRKHSTDVSGLVYFVNLTKASSLPPSPINMHNNENEILMSVDSPSKAGNTIVIPSSQEYVRQSLSSSPMATNLVIESSQMEQGNSDDEIEEKINEEPKCNNRDDDSVHPHSMKKNPEKARELVESMTEDEIRALLSLSSQPQTRQHAQSCNDSSTTAVSSSNRTLSGFTFASGKSINVSTSNMKKGQDMLNQIIMDDSEKAIRATLSYSLTDFKASNIIVNHQKHTQHEQEPTRSYKMKTTLSGFESAHGVSLRVRKSSIKKSQGLLETVLHDTSLSRLAPNTIPSGFSSASGRVVTVAKHNMSKGQALLDSVSIESVRSNNNDVDDIALNDNDNNTRIMSMMTTTKKNPRRKRKSTTPLLSPSNSNKRNCTNVDDIPIDNLMMVDSGFSSASGKKVTVSNNSWKKGQILCDSIMKNDDESMLYGKPSSMRVHEQSLLNLRNNTDNGGFVASGFESASGKKINIKSKSLKRGEKLLLLQDIEKPHDDHDNGSGEDNDGMNMNQIASGFASASGKKVSISSKNLKRGEKLLQNVLQQEPHYDHDNSSSEDNDGMNMNQIASGFASASGKKVSISSKNLKRGEKLLQNVLHQQEQYNSNNNNNNKEMQIASGFESASGLKININASALNRGAQLFADNNDNVSMAPPTATIPTPTRKRKRKSLGGTNRKSFISPAFNATNTPDIPDSIVGKRKRTRSRLGVIPGGTQRPTTPLKNDGGSGNRRRLFTSPRRIRPTDYATTTPSKLLPSKKQERNVEKKKVVIKNPYENVRNNEERMSLKAYTLEETPGKYTHDELLQCGVKSNVIDINPMNASLYSFNDVEGNARGPSQCHETLLSYGALPNCCTLKWVQNHYKWIVWKLAATERSFPYKFGGRYLTYTRVLKQLQYRYHIEFEKAKRSCIRRILEHDDIASKYMVLCVSNIIMNEPKGDNDDNGIRIELTDGWYSVYATVDSELNRIIRTNTDINGKKIFIGQKLCLFGCMLVGEPCTPLEEHNSILKLHYNGVRRARWDAILGYQSTPFYSVRWNTLKSNGGVAPRVYVQIMRQYPLIYIETINDTRVTRNQKAEDLAQETFMRNVMNVEHDNNSEIEPRNVTAFMQVKIRELLLPAVVEGNRRYNEDYITIWRPSDDMMRVFAEGKCLSLIGLKSGSSKNNMYRNSNNSVRMVTSSNTIIEELQPTNRIVVANNVQCRSTRYSTPLLGLQSYERGMKFDIVLYLLAIGEPVSRLGRKHKEISTRLYFGGPGDDVMMIDVIESVEQCHFTVKPKLMQLWNICNIQYQAYDARYQFHTVCATRETVFTTKPYRNLSGFAISFDSLNKWSTTNEGQHHLATQTSKIMDIMDGRY